jgi:2-dehydro-3-deoxyphosphogluconate aldolase/(4S)-4-hydroxy-2-oxoglutarate aldolase
LLNLLKNSRVVPVAVINRVDEALRLTEIYLRNGIPIIEITLRTESAYEAISAVAKTFPEMAAGAGSVLAPEDLSRAFDAGAAFAVSPCFDHEIAEKAKSLSIPYSPGISTPSELNSALKYSSLIKIFPAADLGGPAYIKAVAAPFAMKRFSLMPTGGINEKNLADYLAADRVAACGMTYITDRKLIEAGDYSALENRVRQINAIAASF